MEYNPKKLEDKIAQMIGKTFLYGNRVHYVESIKVDDEMERITVKTNLDVYYRLFESSLAFLDKWELHDWPLSVPEKKNEAVIVAMAEKDNQVADQLITLLMDNIEKVKVNKNYIPQAKAINNDVNSVLQVVKVKIQLNKLYKQNR